MDDYPVTPETIQRAKAARDVERQQAEADMGVRLDEDGNIIRGVLYALPISLLLWGILFTTVRCDGLKPKSTFAKVAPIAAWIGCQAFDAISTAVALRDPRIKEGNPIMRGPQLYAVKVSVNLALGFTQHQIQKRESDGWKRFVLPATLALSGCTAGILNTRTLRSLH